MKRFLVYTLLAATTFGCHIDMPLKPVAKFKFTPENGCQAPCEVTFTSESENAAGLQWDFNDGSPLQTASGNEIKHTFTSGKVYEVKLMVKGVDGGTSGETRSVKIDAAAASAPEADFKYTITNDSIAPATVTFNNQSKNATTYTWDFGDTGSDTNTSTAQNPVHTYSNAGSYVVTLTAKNDENATDTQSYTIVIKAQVPSTNAVSISNGSSFTTDIFVDGSGNIYICGEAAGTIQLGNGKSYTSQSGSRDFFVAKYNSAMQCQWVTGGGSITDDHANGLAVDASGNVFVTGFLAGALVGESITPKGGLDGFVAKFNGSTGLRQWIKTFGGSDKDQGRSIAYFNNKIYLTGFVTGNIDFGGATSSANGTDGFLVSVDPSTGAFAQPTIFGGSNEQQVEDMAFDTDGNIYLTGAFAGSIAFQGIAQPISAPAGYDVFVTKWAPNSGQFQWAKRAGSGADDFTYDIVVDASKNVYVTGMHDGNITELSLPASTFKNVYLGKWNANGEVQKAKNGFNELKDDFHGGIALSTNGNILLAGSFEDKARFPMATGQEKIGIGNIDILITEVDPTELNATGRFMVSDGGTGNDRVNRICVASGYVYATGWFRGTATFNNVQLIGVADIDNTFIVRYKL
ncbi:PKD domain-containing protein [Dyadobacter jiangsuensis]|uniref:Beta-propeller repeat-containing protein n=1 Tax=Dyadobacter jiangsuensis TaxID=1591085 RepID=A0A2P8GB68_9BACT|nr:PKD domain-containing protein [Dyadobacter jiangsuensis]PSL31208.1 beta-propeller repeat-containing protein [Dyadobacter jiangsuensis]